jgi:hypothetical protein
MAIDPYEVGGPGTHAMNIDDVSVPDLGKLTRIQNRAVSVGRALPGRHKQLWVTEFGYDSNPPNPGGVSLTRQAMFLEQAMYTFWQEGVSTAVWYLIRDQAAGFAQNTYYTGLYFYNGTAKPVVEAFRFPFLLWPSGTHNQVWGIAPHSGSLVVQRKVGNSWKTLFHTGVSAGNVFTRNVSAGLHGSFRAMVGGETSLVWTS